MHEMVQSRVQLADWHTTFKQETKSKQEKKTQKKTKQQQSHFS